VSAQRALAWPRAVRACLRSNVELFLATRRGLWTALLLGLPLLLAVAYRLVRVAGAEVGLSAWQVYGDYGVALYWTSLALPLAALFHGTAFAEDVEARTIVFLLARPVPRSALLSGRFLAYALTLLACTLPALLLSFGLLAGVEGGLTAFASRAPELLRDVGLVAFAVLAYGSVFTLLGVLVRRPLVPGVLFVFGWEGLAHLPGYLPRLTLAGPLRALSTHQAPQEGLFGLISPGTIPAGPALLGLLLTTLCCLGLALVIFERREYVLEQ